MFEIHARELRATFLRNHNMRHHNDPTKCPKPGRQLKPRRPPQPRQSPQPPQARGRCTRYVALHPLRGAAPVTWRCTRTEEVHCLRIGCSAPTHKKKRGTGTPRHSPPQPARAQDARRTPGGRWAALLRPRPTRCPNTQRTPASSHGDRGRGRGWLGRRARSAYSLTPPAVRPETMYFCRYWNSRMTGTAARTAPAAKMPHGAVRSSAAHIYIPTASVN